MKHQAALVTGGSKGIGRAIVERLAALGETVVSLSLDDADARLPAHQVKVDLGDVAATQAALADLTGAYDITRLVNNAGIDGGGPDHLSLDFFERVIDVNLRAAVLTVSAVLPAMKARGHGRIVSIASRTVLGKAGFSLYGASKAGLIGLSRSLALELAPHGITVNVVSAGPVDTELGRGGQTDRRGLQDFAARIPLGRIGQPADVADAVLFFLDDRASWITGQNLFVCGGLSVGTAPV